jgi:poly(3-hydroxybutyrate) depolymerase
LAFLVALLVGGTTGCGSNNESIPSKGNTGTDGGTPMSMQPVAAPVADDCITDVSAGDHTFTCSGLTFLVMVDDLCTKYACGLIFDIHGATMSGLQMRDNTHLQELAPPHGYLVVHPSATASNTGGTWDLTNDPPKVADFMTRMIQAFHVDSNRIHVTGFSQGGAMTWWFLCNHNDLLASAGPVAGALNTTP